MLFSACFSSSLATLKNKHWNSDAALQKKNSFSRFIPAVEWNSQFLSRTFDLNPGQDNLWRRLGKHFLWKYSFFEIFFSVHILCPELITILSYSVNQWYNLLISSFSRRAGLPPIYYPSMYFYFYGISKTSLTFLPQLSFLHLYLLLYKSAFLFCWTESHTQVWIFWFMNMIISLCDSMSHLLSELFHFLFSHFSMLKLHSLRVIHCT